MAKNQSLAEFFASKGMKLRTWARVNGLSENDMWLLYQVSYGFTQGLRGRAKEIKELLEKEGFAKPLAKSVRSFSKCTVESVDTLATAQDDKAVGVDCHDFADAKGRNDTNLVQGDKTNQQENKTNNEIQQGRKDDLTTHPQTPSAMGGGFSSQKQSVGTMGFLPHNEGANFTQKATKAQNVALEKMSVVKEWERARTKMSAKDFIASTNAKGDYSLEISENKLYAWQRAYKNGGLAALIDTRGANKKSEIENLGLKELVESLIMASRGRVNVSSIHRLLHAHLASLDRCDMKEFLAKESEVVSYGVLDRYVRAYLRKNPLQKLIIQKGEDGAVSAFCQLWA